MGFDPLQGTKRIVIPVSLTDDMRALHSHIARRALAELRSAASRPRQSLSYLPKHRCVETYESTIATGHLDSSSR